ncbi:hypothetical protein L3Q72_18735 [Vibrio sp. JC009]|uniref:hypothetical protein n=1 Tax=Vibrio sp. JC009 TaxID=2912314 RepID=UPI0023B19B87|nr:hypothetical protein [Vibrio sp. JC009]WED24912.1 hypothetical protein L3Q72_18735 [Vibrio sp. JC009]
MSINTKMKNTLVGAAVLVALYGCGGGGSSDSNTGTSSLSGQAADGYLFNANVCLDLNDNKVCDASDPTVVTGSNGEFTINGLTQEEIDNHSLIVEVVKDVTVDQDNPNTPVDGNYSLTAPVGYTFVSPISTMVQSEIESSSSVDLAAAEEAIKTQLGLDIDPQENYVAKKQSSDTNEQKAYKQLHQVAQIAATLMKNSESDFDSDPGSAQGISTEEKLEWIAEKVSERLETIAEQVIETDDDNVSAASFISTLEQDTDFSFEVSDAKSEIEIKRELQLASASELLTTVTSDGVFSYSAWHNNNYLRAFYNNFKLTTSSDISNAYEDAGVEYQYNGTSWDLRAENGINMVLTSSGWQEVDEDFYISVNEVTGEVTLTNPTYSEMVERFTANKVPLSGKNIADVLKAADFRAAKWANFVDESISFSDSGSVGYRMEFVQLYDRYELWQHNCSANELSNGSGVCYQVWMAGQYGGYALALSDLLSASAATSAADAKGPYVSHYESDSGVQGYVFAEMVNNSSKLVNFYVVTENSQGHMNHSDGEILATGNWEVRQIKGETMYVVPLPPSIRRYSDDDDIARIFVVHENADNITMVHSGEFEPRYTLEEQEMIFNKAAHDEIMAAFSKTKFCAVQTATKQGNPSQASDECP